MTRCKVLIMTISETIDIPPPLPNDIFEKLAPPALPRGATQCSVASTTERANFPRKPGRQDISVNWNLTNGSLQSPHHDDFGQHTHTPTPPFQNDIFEKPARLALVRGFWIRKPPLPSHVYIYLHKAAICCLSSADCMYLPRGMVMANASCATGAVTHFPQKHRDTQAKSKGQ